MKSTLNLEEIRRNLFDLADDSDSDNREMTDILIEKESRFTKAASITIFLMINQSPII
jgi:hypothetical protein